MKYTRIYAGSDLDTHMENVEADMIPRHTAPGSPLVPMSDFRRAAGIFFLEVTEEAEAVGFHISPVKVMAVVLSGELEMETSDGDRRKFKPGDVILYEDNIGLGHKSNNSVGVIFAMVPLKE
ncbi:MAG: cupin domain-containing protein [Bacillota bacterium]